ncbi:hypothetical protein [Acinetobacter zhairhuonensis]|uniref:hypothetical protein n=1 Tax=Acinetobacter sp. A7.4 TaxID=2919921 RepID=UPI001F4F4C7D|nr:hypothetical protein [Acinetobacter sp. A7.4]MCJ8162635.1 hypothetical protein [Acinetobacter sp. A7.4]
MNKVIILLTIIFMQACAGINKDKDGSNEVDVKKEVERIFKNYNYNLKEGMKRDFVSYYNVFVSKQDLSLGEFEKVKGEIEKKWKLVYTSEDQYVFCYDKYNQMTILYPRKLYYYDKFGQKLYIKSSSLDKWGVSLKYIKEGTAYCKNEKFN